VTLHDLGQKEWAFDGPVHGFKAVIEYPQRVHASLLTAALVSELKMKKFYLNLEDSPSRC
jgi:hypothetical protein